MMEKAIKNQLVIILEKDNLARNSPFESNN